MGCGIVRPWRNNTATGVWWTIWQMWRQHLAFLAVLLETSWPTSRWPAISTVKKPNFSWWKFPSLVMNSVRAGMFFFLTLCQPKCLSWSFWFLQPRIWYHNFRIQRGSSHKGVATVHRKWMKHNGIMSYRPRMNFIQLVVFVQDLHNKTRQQASDNFPPNNPPQKNSLIPNRGFFPVPWVIRLVFPCWSSKYWSTNSLWKLWTLTR